MLDAKRAEGKRTLLDPPEASARAKWLVRLFFPLRSTAEWGKRLSHLEIEGYLRMRGYDVVTLYDWILVADAAAVEWMAERSREERERAQRKAENARRPIRH